MTLEKKRKTFNFKLTETKIIHNYLSNNLRSREVKVSTIHIVHYEAEICTME